MFSRKTKVPCYKSEINKSVCYMRFKKTKVSFYSVTKTEKYPVANKSIALRLKKASNKISANRISNFVTF